MSEARDSRFHAGIARVGVLLIAAGAFRVSYDAWTTVSKASGIRPGLAGYLPWITEGFLALAVYTAWVVRKRGANGKYPVTLAFVLLLVGVYVQVRHGMSHGHPLMLTPIEAGAVSALPTIITAASIHLLVITFEKVAKAEESAPEGPAPVIPDTVEELTDNWAKEPAQVEPMPEPVIPEPEVTSPSASRFPVAGTGAGAPALRGAGGFMALAEQTTDDRTRAYWMKIANAHGKN